MLFALTLLRKEKLKILLIANHTKKIPSEMEVTPSSVKLNLNINLLIIMYYFLKSPFSQFLYEFLSDQLRIFKVCTFWFNLALWFILWQLAFMSLHYFWSHHIDQIILAEDKKFIWLSIKSISDRAPMQQEPETHLVDVSEGDLPCFTRHQPLPPTSSSPWSWIFIYPCYLNLHYHHDL